MRLQGILAGCEAFIERREDSSRFEEHQALFEEAVEDASGKYTPPTSICFVECEEGKEFAINLKRGPVWRGKDFGVSIYIDGRQIQGYSWSRYDRTFVCRTLIQQRPNGLVSVNLKFRGITLVEEGQGGLNKGLVDLGTIRLVFYQGQLGPSKPGGAAVVITQEMGPISEKIKKGMIGQTVGGGSETPLLPGTTSYFVYDNVNDDSIPWFPRPGYQVIFKYRSRQLLIANDIIPNPTPGVTSPDQGRRRRKRRAVLNEEEGNKESGTAEEAILKVKTEFAELRSVQRVKRERQIGPSAPGEIGAAFVDLTIKNENSKAK